MLLIVWGVALWVASICVALSIGAPKHRDIAGLLLSVCFGPIGTALTFMLPSGRPPVAQVAERVPESDADRARRGEHNRKVAEWIGAVWIGVLAFILLLCAYLWLAGRGAG